MKKSLLAVAAMTAFAGAAQAQSSVTVYGILDVGYQGGNSTIANNGAATINMPAPNAALPNGQVKTTQNVLGQSAEQTSRLGFKGSEDLGGGKSAFFTAEFTLTPNDQTLSGNTNGGLKNRQTFVGLKQNGVGDFAVGTQYTPVFNANAATNTGQFNNMVGSLMYTGQADSSLSSTADPQYGGGYNAMTTRVSNAITFNTDTFAGFKGHLMAIINNSNSTQASTGALGATSGGNVNTNGWGLGADYTWNKLFIAGAYQALKQNTSAVNSTQPTGLTANTAAPATTANSPQVFGNSAAAGIALCTAGYNGATTAITNYSCANQAINIQDNQGYIGATYDFGILKAYASWITRKASDTQNSGVYQKRQAEEIGVRSFITPTIEGWASAGVGTFTPMGYNQNSAHMNAWQLGSNYWLSKRTNLYAIYGQYAQGVSTYNTYNANGTPATTAVTSVNNNSYAIGVRHTF